MYDELIKRLRETPSIPVDAKLHNEAADAIEELLASCNNFEAALKDSVEECEKLQLYGVSKKTMQNAINGVTWKCVPYFPEPPEEKT